MPTGKRRAPCGPEGEGEGEVTAAATQLIVTGRVLDAWARVLGPEMASLLARGLLVRPRGAHGASGIRTIRKVQRTSAGRGGVDEARWTVLYNSGRKEEGGGATGKVTLSVSRTKESVMDVHATELSPLLLACEPRALVVQWNLLRSVLERVALDRLGGRHAFVKGEMWGAAHTQHQVWVLLREWVPGHRGLGDGSYYTWLRVTKLTPGARQGTVELAPSRSGARAYDETSPDLTALRAVRECAGRPGGHEDDGPRGLSLELVRASTLLRADLAGAGAREVVHRYTAPRAGDGRCTHGALFPRRVTAEAAYLPPPTDLQSSVQLHVVDLDQLRAGGRDFLREEFRVPLAARWPVDGLTVPGEDGHLLGGLQAVPERAWRSWLPLGAGGPSRPARVHGDRFGPCPAEAGGVEEDDEGPPDQEPNYTLHAAVKGRFRALAHASELLGRLRATLCPARRGNWARVFHGTDETSAEAIVLSGQFARPTCKETLACQEGRCKCQMLGFGVYFADRAKASRFARARGKEKGTRGVVIEVLADLGHSKRALPTPCPCGCGTPFTDHRGRWYDLEGFDSLFVADGSRPAASEAEVCIVDPRRVRVVGAEALADA